MDIQKIKLLLSKYSYKIFLVILLFIVIFFSINIKSILYYYKIYKIDNKIKELSNEELNLKIRLNEIQNLKVDIFKEKSFYINDTNTKIKLFCESYDRYTKEKCIEIINNNDYDGLKKFLITNKDLNVGKNN